MERAGPAIWSETTAVRLRVLSFGNCSTFYSPQPIPGQRRPILLVQPDFLRCRSGLPHLAFRVFAGTRRAIFRFWDHKPSIGEAVPEGEQTNSYKGPCRRHSRICYNGRSPWVTPSPVFSRCLDTIHDHGRQQGRRRLEEASGLPFKHQFPKHNPGAPADSTRRSLAAACGFQN